MKQEKLTMGAATIGMLFDAIDLLSLGILCLRDV